MRIPQSIKLRTMRIRGRISNEWEDVKTSWRLATVSSTQFFTEMGTLSARPARARRRGYRRNHYNPKPKGWDRRQRKGSSLKRFRIVRKLVGTDMGQLLRSGNSKRRRKTLAFYANFGPTQTCREMGIRQKKRAVTQTSSCI